MSKSRGSWAIRTLVLMVAMALAGVAHADGTTGTTTSAPDTAAPTYTTHATTRSDAAPSAGAMAFDLVLVRPLSLAATLIGTGLFIVNLPLSVFEKDAPAQPFQRLVVDPARYTFTRPLGALH